MKKSHDYDTNGRRAGTWNRSKGFGMHVRGDYGEEQNKHPTAMNVLQHMYRQPE